MTSSIPSSSSDGVWLTNNHPQKKDDWKNLFQITNFDQLPFEEQTHPELNISAILEAIESAENPGDALDEHGLTILHMAVYRKCIPAIEKLAERGVDMNARLTLTAKGVCPLTMSYSPLDLALLADPCLETVRCLCQHGAFVDYSFYSLSRTNVFGILENSLPLFTMDEKQKKLFTDIFKVLINCPLIQGPRTSVPISIAVRLNSISLIEELLKNDFPLNSPEMGKLDPLETAMLMNELDVDVIRYLINNGAHSIRHQTFNFCEHKTVSALGLFIEQIPSLIQDMDCQLEEILRLLMQCHSSSEERAEGLAFLLKASSSENSSEAERDRYRRLADIMIEAECKPNVEDDQRFRPSLFQHLMNGIKI